VVETDVAAFLTFQSAPPVMESHPIFFVKNNMNYLINQVLSGNSLRHCPMAAVLWKLICLLVLFLAVGCATVPHTGRRQFNMVSDQQLSALSQKAFQEVVAKEPECKDQRLNEIVRKVTTQVNKAAEMIDKPKFDWDVRVIDKDVPNAFCLPGGKMIVYTGMVKYARNEAGLAAVIAHETAHAVARHGGERLSQQAALKGAIAVGGEVLKNEDGSMDTKARVALGALGMGGTIGIVLPYSRVHELEADRIGQLYMAAAGYDPSEAGRLWERMSKIKKPPIPVWLSTHPPDEDRIRNLSECLPEAQKLYAAAPTKYGLGAPL
jgi:metalloendopeptidase OMA1, mitochondrial